MKDGKSIAVVPGSFDPITNGHIDIVKRAAEAYDVVYLAVMVNDQKKYMLDMEQRRVIAEACLCDIPNVNVISSDGMLWQLAKELCADAIVKGYRNEVDYEYEQKMAQFNYEHNQDAPTVLLKADQDLETLSSTVVRERIANDMPISDCLPEVAIKMLKEFLAKKEI
ncbi:MAG: pantetheine-phosphate adenylyltransferase [Ruminococcaceae bacterium]|nr:pantetheine-phosphate adenylyltransferase [Oscillospiraceae bacterium]